MSATFSVVTTIAFGAVTKALEKGAKVAWKAGENLTQARVSADVANAIAMKGMQSTWWTETLALNAGAGALAASQTGGNPVIDGAASAIPYFGVGYSIYSAYEACFNPQ